MIKDLLISFKDNIKSKSANPLFGAIIIVWLVKNWNLFFSLYYFEPKASLVEKRAFVIEHFTARPFLGTLLWCIGEAFIVLALSYLLLNAARLIINLFEKRLTPHIYKLTDEKSIVLKSKYDALENERKRLEKKIEEERDGRLKLQEDIERLEKRLASTTEIIEPIKDENSNQTIQPTPDVAQRMFENLKKNNELANFEKATTEIINQGPLKKDTDYVIEFTTLGLIRPTKMYGDGSGNYYIYTMTDLGIKVRDLLILDRISG
jgi:hypothetical protein